jgi:hypothetical protein
MIAVMDAEQDAGPHANISLGEIETTDSLFGDAGV